MSGATGRDGRVALVTGAAYGLGKDIAQTLARLGMRLVLGDIDDRLDAAGAEISAQGAEVVTLRMDVCHRAAFAEAAALARQSYGRLDVLVNNAGYSRTTMPLLDMDVQEWERSLQINTRAALFGIQEAAPLMIAGGSGGRIVNIASTAAFRPFNMKAAYCVSKTALVALTRCGALELAPHRITVNAVAPGQTETETTLLLQADPKVGAAMRARAAAIPLGSGLPRHVSAAVAFLASADAEHITGQVWPVDGGTLLV